MTLLLTRRSTTVSPSTPVTTRSPPTVTVGFSSAASAALRRSTSSSVRELCTLLPWMPTLSSFRTTSLASQPSSLASSCIRLRDDDIPVLPHRPRRFGRFEPPQHRHACFSIDISAQGAHRALAGRKALPATEAIVQISGSSGTPPPLDEAQATVRSTGDAQELVLRRAFAASHAAADRLRRRSSHDTFPSSGAPNSAPAPISSAASSAAEAAATAAASASCCLTSTNARTALR